MLLDSLEAVDAERIATLVEYFSEHVENLLIALLPEGAAALDDDDQWVAEIWDDLFNSSQPIHDHACQRMVRQRYLYFIDTKEFDSNVNAVIVN